MEKMKTKQRQNCHRQRKLANIRKEAARYRDGQGKLRKAIYDGTHLPGTSAPLALVA